jgi:hypothetical protein
VYSNSFTANFPTSAADPGPSQGLRPAHPLLANGPEVNRTLLAQLFPPGSRVKNTGTVFFDSPDRRLPFTHQMTVGFEQQLGSVISVSADYIHAFGRDQFMSKDLNAGLRTTTSRTAPIVRPNSFFSSLVTQRLNLGKTDYDALMLQFEKRFSSNYSFRASYTLSSREHGNSSIRPVTSTVDDAVT